MADGLAEGTGAGAFAVDGIEAGTGVRVPRGLATGAGVLMPDGLATGAGVLAHLGLGAGTGVLIPVGLATGAGTAAPVGLATGTGVRVADTAWGGPRRMARLAVTSVSRGDGDAAPGQRHPGGGPQYPGEPARQPPPVGFHAFLPEVCDRLGTGKYVRAPERLWRHGSNLSRRPAVHAHVGIIRKDLSGAW